MNRSVFTALLLASTLAAIPPAFGCGVGLFNIGGGLRYQGYLAPRPATVLVYDDATPGAQRKALYAGLQKAGHRVTVVTDTDALTQALGEKRYDVIIASFADVDSVAARAAGASAQPQVLPVVERNARNEPALRRFPLYLLDGASLGQYLKVINQALSLHAP